MSSSPAAIFEDAAALEGGHGGFGVPGVVCNQVSHQASQPRLVQGARSQNSTGSMVAPTAKELQQMTPEQVDHWLELYMQEHRAQMAQFDPDTIERHPMAGGDAAVTFKDVAFSIEVPDTEDSKQKRKVQKTILEDCCGHFEAGSLVALMGPSGCGKTTLLDILAKKKTTAYAGSVYLNGREVDAMYQRIAAYVGQQDNMPEHWTVGDAVAFNAALKSETPAGITQAQTEQLIDSLLHDLGLLHVKDTKIGGESVRGISGGQRRRVTLARGIASRSQVMYCDEPTSGLSATDAELCMKTLRLAAKKWNVTIVVVIHQPRVEVARLFDHLVLLTSRPGRIVYNGPMSEAVAYWASVGFPVPEHVNPTDYFLDTVTPGAQGADPEHFVEQYKLRQLPDVQAKVEKALRTPGATPLELLESKREKVLNFGDVPKLRCSRYAVSFWTQLRMVFGRKLKLMLVDSQLMGLTVFMQIFMGIFMGLCFFNVGSKAPEGVTQMSFLFNVLMQVSLCSMNIMPQLIDERNIMKLEVSEALYSEWPHIISTTILSTAQNMVGNTFFVILMFALGGMDWSHFLPFYLWATLLFLAMDSMCAMVAAMAKNAQVAQAVAMPFLMVFIMFSGFLVSKNSAPDFLRWLLYVSPVSWVTETIAKGLYGNNTEAWSSLHTLYGFEKVSHGELICAAMCIASIVVFRFAQAVCLKHMNKIER